MTLREIIRKKKFATATDATAATHTEQIKVTVASVAVANCKDEKSIQIEIEIIRAWLYKIGEPPEGHYLILDKCKSDPEAMEYFYKQANGEFDE